MSGDLERRYRRLLAWYPTQYRHTYEDEMLGVLLAGARHQQRYPSMRETLDVLRSALWIRIGRTVSRPLDSRWRDAAAMFGLFVPLALVAQQLGAAVGRWAWSWRMREPSNVPAVAAWPFDPSVSVGASTLAGWLLVAALTLCGWRLIAAMLAWATVLAEASVLALRYHSGPVDVLHAWPLFVLGVTIAATLSVRAPVRRAATVLGWRRATLLVAALTAAAGLPALDPLLTRVTRSGPTGLAYRFDVWPRGTYLASVFTPGTGFMFGAGLVTLVVSAFLAVIVLTVFVKLSAPIRRRLLALSMPVAAVAVVIRLGFNGFEVSSPRFSPPVLLVAGQWVTLLATPLLAFVVGVAVVHRQERRAHLIQLGQVTERQLLPSKPGNLPQANSEPDA